MRKQFLSVIALLSLILISTAAEAKTDIEFILDASGSMKAAMGTSTQIDVARQAIKTALDALPPDAYVALRVYAHRIDQADKMGSCADSELMIPFGPMNKASIGAKIDSIQPKGFTPIAYSLEQAEKDFGIDRESTHVLVLVSDGEETCGGDPVKVVQGLIAKGFKIKLNAVGFNVDPKAQTQLAAIAQAGGGQYYDARDPAALAATLKDIAQKSFLVEKTTAVYGSEIQGGDSYEKAAPMPLGQEMRLSHHQRKGQYDYFSIDLKAGQSLIVTMNSGAKGVSISGQNVQENENVYAGYQIHDSQRNKVAGEELIGAKNQMRSTQVDATAPQRVYLLIGSQYEDMHKDNTFKAEVKDFFDAGTQSDAGPTPQSAVPTQRQDYPENYLTSKDESDCFKIPTVERETLSLQILPENMKSRLSATLYDSLNTELGKGSSPNDGAGFRVSGTATGTATYLCVQRYYPSGEPTRYSIKFEGAPAAPAPVAGTTQPMATQPIAAPLPMPAAQPQAMPAMQPAEKKGAASFEWTSPKILAIVLGSGFLIGFVAGILITLRLKRKKAGGT